MKKEGRKKQARSNKQQSNRAGFSPGFNEGIWRVVQAISLIIKLFTCNEEARRPRVRRHVKAIAVHVQYESKKVPVSVPFTSVLTVYRGQTVLAPGMNSSAKFTACVGEA